jgi:large subunit ribosomal protein L4
MALKHALSSKQKDGALIVVDAFSGEKTKDLVAQLKKLGIKNALFIGGAQVDEKFAKAASNIPNIDVLPLAGLNVYDVLRRQTLVLSREAVEGVNARFAEAEKA